MLDVIDYDNFAFDEEGLNNYLQFGYSVLGQTMVKDVKFLPPNAAIQNTENGLIIIQNDDPVENILGKREEKSDEETAKNHFAIKRRLRLSSFGVCTKQ